MGLAGLALSLVQRDRTPSPTRAAQSAGGIVLGRTATISGQVIPAHRGQPIRLQHKRERTWHTTQKKTLPASGRYSFAPRPCIHTNAAGADRRAI